MPRNHEKPSAVASPLLRYGMDAISKGALIDLVVHLARATIGPETSDEDVARWIDGHHSLIARQRNDPYPNVVVRMRRLAEQSRAYREKNGG